jgi:aminoglycoside phosphotransferase (APT) family kinase protein
MYPGFVIVLTPSHRYNENLRLSERRLIFNVAELMKAAANSINKPESVIARMPYPSTLPRRLAVASEVATMNFVRAHGVPTPRILGYAINENPVGSEYILMENLPGRPIGDAWFDL